MSTPSVSRLSQYLNSNQASSAKRMRGSGPKGAAWLNPETKESVIPLIPCNLTRIEVISLDNPPRDYSQKASMCRGSVVTYSPKIGVVPQYS